MSSDLSRTRGFRQGNHSDPAKSEAMKSWVVS